MNSDRNITVNVTNRTIIRSILWVVGAILLYHFIGRISHALILIFSAFFLAMALDPAVSWVSRRLKIRSRVRATAVAYLMIIAAITVFLALVIPPLVRQTRAFITDVPQTVATFQAQDTSLSRTFHRYKLDDKLTNGAKDFSTQYSNFGTKVFDTGKRIVEGLASLFAVIVMAFMMLVEGPRWLQFAWGLAPSKNRKRYQQIAHKMYKGVSGFVNGQLILSLVAGVFAFVALEVASQFVNADVNALALAGIVAVFGLIPLFGNPLAATIVVLVSLIGSGTLGLIMFIYFIVYFFVENHTFQPYIQSKLNDLTPLTVFVAAILGISLAGLLGAIIAIPAATAAKILLEDQLERLGVGPASSNKS